MTLDIPLSPEVEAHLRKYAIATGREVRALVKDVIEEKLSTVVSSESPRRQSPAIPQGTPEWFAALDVWQKSHPARQFLADDSREAIYGDEVE